MQQGMLPGQKSRWLRCGTFAAGQPPEEEALYLQAAIGRPDSRHQVHPTVYAQ